MESNRIIRKPGGLTKRSLTKIFKPKLTVPAQHKPFIKVNGPAPHINWASVADSFVFEHYNTEEPQYGWWITPELWDALNPYGHQRKQGVFHPSSGLHHEAGSCDRAVAFDLICAPRSKMKISAKICKVLDNGTNRHIGLNVLFYGLAANRYMGALKFEHEVKIVNPYLPIEGSLDGKLYMDNGRIYVFDYKTCSDNVFKTLYKPKSKHFMQLNMYIGSGDRTSTGYVLYENKNNQNWGIPGENFRVDFNEKLYSEQMDYCRGILAIIGSLDNLFPDFDEKVCKENIDFCSYKDTCKKVQNGQKPSSFDRRTPELKKRHLKVLG